MKEFALQSKSPSAHNQMMRHRISHPSSTNFDHDFANPMKKRIKRLESTDSSLSRGQSEDEERPVSPQPRPIRREIADSEDESDDEVLPRASQGTDLESALPPVKTDKEAIAEYESSRAAEDRDLDLHERLGQRKWIQGKSSIYVDAFNLALETVLEDESHLFDETEMAVFDRWKSLSYEGQYLYVRLFLRKTAAWHRIDRLGYYGDITDLPAAAKEILHACNLPARKHTNQIALEKAEPPIDVVSRPSFTFADGSEGHINTLEEASSLLRLDELKAFAKEAKLQGKNKQELLNALRRVSQDQGALEWSRPKKSEDEELVDPEKLDIPRGEVHDVFEGISVNRDSHFLRKILSTTGPCIRLTSAPLKLFERVHLVFYRSTEWTEKSLSTIILARISRRNFPEYIVSRSTNIFSSRSALMEFEASLRTQFLIDDILEMNGTVSKVGLQKVKDVFEDIYPRWQTLVIEEQKKEDRLYESGEGAYLRRFSPAWVYTRIVHKGTYVLGRFKEHQREYQLLTELLAQRLFHTARRGSWYQRKALLEEHYMHALVIDDDRPEDAKRKSWKMIALQTCESGLQDKDCHLVYHHDLQKRVMKLEKALKIAKRQQHDFGHVYLAKAIERTVEGIRIEKEQTPSRSGSRRESNVGSQRRGGKTVWVDEREGGGECSVEAMCLSWYRDQGWKGYHSEGGIVRTLFGYLFHDILFTYVPNVFQTPYQTCPLDLHTDAFFPSRASEINHRLVEITNGATEKLLREVHVRESEKQTCIVGLDWSYEITDLLEIAQCIRGEALATICKVMAQEYQQRGGGIPDLFLWHAEKKEVMFSEVKSQNDRLSDTQRLWIHVLTGAGIKVELCLAIAKEVIVQRQ